MKLHYYPETDSLYVELKAGPGAETREVSEGLNVDLDADGNVLGLDIDQCIEAIGSFGAGDRVATGALYQGQLNYPAFPTCHEAYRNNPGDSLPDRPWRRACPTTRAAVPGGLFGFFLDAFKAFVASRSTTVPCCR